MFLKNKKLRGMSLVELLAYTVILSIVTTALFQLIHFIQKMNDDLIKEQEIYSEFNIALLKLDTFVYNGSNINVNQAGYCIEDSAESFYFTNDGALCNKKKIVNSTKSLCPTEEERSVCDIFITKPIFKTSTNFFKANSIDNVNATTEVVYDFYVPTNSMLSTKEIYSYTK